MPHVESMVISLSNRNEGSFFNLQAFPKHFNFSLFPHIFHYKTIFESKGKDSPLLLLLLVIKGILVHVYDFGAISGGSE